MKFTDFEYDGIKLSDMGYVVCKFNSNGLQTISNGSQISFDTVPVQNGLQYKLLGTKYDECLESTIQICKNTCTNDNLEISIPEYRTLAKWLNREGFHKFKIINDEYNDIYFEASFNISRIEFDGAFCGLELHIITNSSFAFQEHEKIIIQTTTQNSVKSFNSISDKIGHIYPYRTEITILEDGDLRITNSLENDREVYIRGCKNGETIYMNYPIITSSLQSHNIQNDFNWNFLRIINTFDSNRNELTISLKCKIVIEYNPVIKIGL